jgi:hypothetical protein
MSKFLLKSFNVMCKVTLFANKSSNALPERVKFEKSFSNRCPEAWKNSQKSAVVGGGDGESRVNELGLCRQLDEAGDMLELGVPTS